MTTPNATHPPHSLAWAICTSSTVATALSDRTLEAAILAGTFDGQMEGVDEKGNSLVQAYLCSVGPHMFSFFPMHRHALAALLARDPDRWHENGQGLDRIDMLFHAGFTKELLEDLKSDPAGPASWKDRLYRHPTNPRLGVGQPWLHHLVLHADDKIQALEFAKTLPEVAFDQINEAGDTVLFLAKSPEVVRWLLEHGASPAHKNVKGQTAAVAWSAAQLKTEDLRLMRKALGKANTSLADTVADICQLSQTASAGLLLQSWEKARLAPDAQHEGFGILGWAAKRLLSTQSSRASLRAAWLLIDALMARPEIVNAAHVQDVALLRIIACHRTKHEREDQVVYDTLLRARLPLLQGSDLDIVDAIGKVDWQMYCFAEECVPGVEAFLRLGAQNDPQNAPRWAEAWFDLVQNPSTGISRALTRAETDVKFHHHANGLCPVLKDHPRAWEYLLVRPWGTARDAHLEAMAQALSDNQTSFPEGLEEAISQAPVEIASIVQAYRLSTASPVVKRSVSVRL